MVEDEADEANRVEVMVEPMLLVDVVVPILEDEVGVPGTTTRQVKTHIKSELAAPEASEHEEQVRVEVEVALEVDPEAEIEEMATSPEAVEEVEVEEDAEAMTNHRKLRSNQSQRTAMVISAANKSP